MKWVERNPLLVVVIALLGVSVSAICVRYSGASSVVTSAYRLFWTVALLTPYAWGKTEIRQSLLNVDKKTFIISIVSGIALALHFTWWFESLAHTTVASSTVIVCTEVIWVALGFCLFLRGRMSSQAVLAISITLFGCVMVAWSDSMEMGAHLYGDFLALIAAVAVAVYTLLGRLARERVSTTVYTYIVYVSAAVTLFIMALAGGEALFEFRTDAMVVSFLLSVCSTLMGHSLFSWCLKYFSPTFVSAVKLCEPVVASIMALMLFGEVPGLWQLLGGGIILGGVVYYSRIEARK